MRRVGSWLSAMATNLAIAVLAATTIWLVGLASILACTNCRSHFSQVRLVSGCFTSSINSKTPSGPMRELWNFHVAALQGSSHYDLPSVLLVHRQYRGAPCPPSLQPYPVLPVATSVTGSPGACFRPAPYAAPKP